MRGHVIVVAKALIVVLFAGLLFAQVWFIPVVSNAMADDAPEFEQLRVPGIVLPILLIACIELVLVCVWRLLSMVRADRIFQESAFAWVNAVLVAILAATALVIAGAVVLLRARADFPLLGVVSAMTVVIGIGLALLVAVMKGLLRKATSLEREMSAVV